MSNQPPKAGFIFLCSNATEGECLERMLLGGTKKYQSKIRAIQPGDKLFLYNYSTGRLHGEFVAVSQSQINIVPEAWKGKFPWQVKVNWGQKYQSISRTDMEGVLKFRDFPTAILTDSQLEAIERIFISEKRLPHLDSDFRNKHPATVLTNDGHFVRSQSEFIIDNWLLDQRIVHGYEKKVPNKDDEDIFCDFFIFDSITDEMIYIEFWGREDNKYLERKERKLVIYRNNDLKLIEITPSDLKAPNDTLPKKFRLYLKDHKFR